MLIHNEYVQSSKRQNCFQVIQILTEIQSSPVKWKIRDAGERIEEQ